MQVYWKTNARKMYIIMQMSILGQNFIQIQSDKEHTHIHSHILNHKKASSIIYTTKSISLRQTLLRPTTHSTSLPPVIWFMIQCRIFSIEAFFSSFLFFFISISFSILSSFVWWYFDDTDNRFSNPSLQFLFGREKKSEQRQQKMANRRMTMHKILICFRLNAFSL